MKNKSELKKLIIYSIFFAPLILFALELSFAALNKFRGIRLESDYFLKYDGVNGWRGLQINATRNDKYWLYLDKHTHFETPFEVDASTKNKNIGILISGNSFNAGLFPENGEKNKDTYFSRLETKLRNEKLNVDVVNVSFLGYNLWQEHVEITRYLNSSPIHDDLPNINLVISTGGIQDFLNFVELLGTGRLMRAKEYLNANGMMQNIFTLKYVDQISLAKRGSVSYGFKAFLNSISAYWQLNSHTQYYLKELRFQTKEIVAGLIGRNRWERLRGIKKLNLLDENKIKYGLTLEEIVNQKYKIKLEKYLEIRDYSINSAVRNIKATKALLGDTKYVYLYTPTSFNSDINEDKARDLIDREMGITLGDYQKLENDFRKEFLKKVTALPEVIVLDYSGMADTNTWFSDYTHLNLYGEKKFSELIYPEVSKLVKNIIAKSK